MGSMVTIVSRYPQRIADRIIQDLERSATVMNGRARTAERTPGFLQAPCADPSSTVETDYPGRRIPAPCDGEETTEDVWGGLKEIVS